MSDVTLLYRSRRGYLLWGLLLITLAPVPLSTWLVSLPSETQLLAEFDSLSAGRVWQAAMVALSSVLFWPMYWLSGRYVLTVEVEADGVLRLRLWTLLGPRMQEWRQPFAGGEMHDGRADIQATAPWTGYRTPTGRLLVMDGHGEFPRGEDALRTVLLAAGR